MRVLLQKFPLSIFFRQAFQKLFDFSRAFRGNNQSRIRCLHNDNVMQINAGNQFFRIPGKNNAVPAVQQFGIALYHIVGFIGRIMIAHRGPIADVIPVERCGYDKNFRKFFLKLIGETARKIVSITHRRRYIITQIHDLLIEMDFPAAFKEFEAKRLTLWMGK